MPAIAMTVIDARKHPDADTLWIYGLQAPGTSPCQIVAGLEDTYGVGDTVAVVRCGSTLLDGTQIHKARLRGVVSMGMALGKTDATPGENLSERFCKPEKKNAPQHIAWASIGALSSVWKELQGRATHHNDAFSWPSLRCRAKVKLHGVLPSGAVVAQSRNLILNSDAKSIAGFSRWVAELEPFFSSLAREETVVIFGEFCGESIQKGTALNKIGRKIFAIFAVQIGDDRTHEAKLEVDPDRISTLVGPRPEGVYVLPWHGEELELNYADRDTIQRAATVINDMVLCVERCDPWVKETFGVEGIGEGVVVYPVTKAGHYDVKMHAVSRDEITHLMFKAKGQKHAASKKKKPAQIDPEIARSIDDFAQIFVTEARCEQAIVEACEGQRSKQQMGAFLRWIALDVRKESVHELDASGLTWKQVSRKVNVVARAWLFAHAERL